MNIGYYAHQHGSGHLRMADRLACWAETLPAPPLGWTIFTSVTADSHTLQSQNAKVIRLPNEDPIDTQILPGRAGRYWQPQALHYSPVGHRGILERSQAILAAVVAQQIELMVVDVSVEVALLCRTASVPYAYVRLPGDRTDQPHLQAFAGAVMVIAPYPKMLESPATPDWVVQKTYYLGFVPQAPTNEVSIKPTRSNCTQQKQAFWQQVKTQSEHKPSMFVTVVKGFGGHASIDAHLKALRSLLPTAFITSLGPIAESAKAHVDHADTVTDVQPYLLHSDLVVMASGLNATAQLCQTQTPAVLLPQSRPHDEQVHMANALFAVGRAHCWQDFTALGAKLAQMQVAPELQSRLCYNQTDELLSSWQRFACAKSWFWQWLWPQLQAQGATRPSQS